MVGSLMYLVATRPDLQYSMNLVSIFLAKPTEMHLQAVKRILRYLKGTSDYGIMYRKGKSDLVAYTDSDYAGDLDDKKSTSGYVFFVGSGAVSWLSKKQHIITLSSTEAEFVAAAGCASQAVWLRRVTEQLGCVHEGSTMVHCDNSSTIQLSRNPVLNGRNRHIDVRFHFLRELVQNGVINLVHCGTKEQIADILTKPLQLDVFLKFRDFLGVCKAGILN